MAIKLFKSKSALNEVNLLELTPVKVYTEETDADGNVIVLIPKFKNQILVKYLMPKMKSRYFKLKLDKFGSGVWVLLNGNNNVKFIAEELINKFGDEIQPVYDRLPKFMTMLYSNKLITFKEIDKQGE
jgi:hypothetical protein